jgi:PAS domain S-box-containing protein
MKRLIQINKNRIVKYITLTQDRYTLGRDPGCDLVFTTAKVSRLHALLAAEAKGYQITDNDSANHLYVNGERVKTRLLASGDEISLSREVTLLYLDENAADDKISGLIDLARSTIQQQDLTRLKEVTSRILALDNLDRILDLILEEAVKLVGANRGFIAFVGPGGQLQLENAVSLNIPLGHHSHKRPIYFHSVVTRALAFKSSVFILNTGKDKDTLTDNALTLEVGAVMCSPLILGEQALGVLYVDSGHELAEFDELDRFFFAILADHAAIAIENAKLFSRAEMSIQQLREEVQESEERYRQLVELSPEAIIVHTDGKIVFANGTAVRLLGAARIEALLGQPVLDFVHPDFQAIALDRSRRELAEGQPAPLLEEKFVRLDGTVVDVEVASAPLNYQGQQSILDIVRDITRRKQMESELLRAQKLESLGVLAGGIAHDFNNILAAISTHITISRLQASEQGQALERLAEAEKAVVRARDLTQQLLTFSKGGDPVTKTAAIGHLIRESALLVLHDANSQCQFNLPEDLWPVDIDEGQISRVIYNLVINANQAMPEGGTIHLSGANIVWSAAKDGHALADGRYVKLTVTDSGAGISREHLAKIFDPYFTTKQTGTGLGLATAYSIIKRHRGHITVKSEPGAGASFFIYLPASNQVAAPLLPPADIALGQGKILVVDDDALLRQGVGDLLEYLGYACGFARDGVEAIALYQASYEAGEPFTAVIMDLTIPGGMGGKEAVQQLLQLDPQARVIVASGYSDDPVMSSYQEFGFCGVLCKPFELADLSAALQAAPTM